MFPQNISNMHFPLEYTLNDKVSLVGLSPEDS
jgi:hypothetical protein